MSLRIHHRESCTKLSNWSNKIKMPKSTTGYRIKSSIPTENMNAKKLRATKCNSSIFSQVSLK